MGADLSRRARRVCAFAPARVLYYNGNSGSGQLRAAAGRQRAAADN
jgi:hypothetical protein